MSLHDISTQLRSFIDQELDIILNSIAKQYKLDYLELKKQYINNDNNAIKSIPTNDEIIPKKRGRKKKQKEEFIEAEEYEYEGVMYLVDNKNTVYTNNLESPIIVGEKLINGSIKFYKQFHKS